jgi:uroporphyrinogen-III synthase
MKGKTIAVLESRLGAQLVDLVGKRGGIPLHAPALAEVPDVQPQAIRALISAWNDAPFTAVIFQTGVGTRALFDASDALGLSAEFLRLLAQTRVIVRGPKPTGVLRARAVRIDRSAADPFTSVEVLKLLDDMELRGTRVLVQSYGERNQALDASLEQRGATVVEIPTYRWALPEDTHPLEQLLDALQRGEIHATMFTSASQVRNLYEVARALNREAALIEDLNRTMVASIGPVCSKALRERGIHVTREASPPKLGPLLTAVEEALNKAVTE